MMKNKGKVVIGTIYSKKQARRIRKEAVKASKRSEDFESQKKSDFKIIKKYKR